ncbi:fungal-specific transcription factor domain-containing protein [Lipomyces kononenkoae]|uniref:Fungal-specific transcription factor domain-containing protein n=1 Tax=Lipomyces kononenkoae TaxID=34357 RepID=A0ACC3T4Z8_LIPKO
MARGPEAVCVPLHLRVTSSHNVPGCWTCRKRHQKCDEAKPACWNCRFRGVECGGYGVRLTDFTTCSGLDGQMVSKVIRGGPGERETDLSKTPSEPKSRPLRPATVARSVPIEHSKRNGRPLVRPKPRDTSGASPISVGLVEEALPAGSSASNGHLHDGPPGSSQGSVEDTQELRDVPSDELGLLSTETAHGSSSQQTWWQDSIVANSEDEESFSQSMELSLESGFESHLTPGSFTLTSAGDVIYRSPTDLGNVEERAPDSDQPVEEESGAVDQAILRLINERVLQPPPGDPFDQYLFSHYINDLSLRLYPVKPEQNPYRLVYGSLATKSQPLLKAILFASAMHLSKLGRLPNFAVQPYRMAMRDSFRDALQSGDEAWGLGATVLLSIVFDVIGTGLDTWSSKLIGCRRLLQMALSNSNGHVADGLKCMLLQYNWAVTMGRTLLKGVRPPAALDDLRCIDGASGVGREVGDRDMAAHQSHWFNNLPDFRMHQFLREATDLSAAVDRLKSASCHIDEILQLMPQVAELINRIQDWQPDFSSVEPEYIGSVEHFNAIWRQGMLCYVFHEIYALPSSHSRIQACVEASLEPFRKLSWLQACLFPVFMIAVHAQTEEARLCFETGLTAMNTSLAFQAPLSVIMILKTIWERSDNMTGQASWRDIIKEFRMELNILL